MHHSDLKKDDSEPQRATLRGLDGLNFFLADVQTGVGPFLAVYLAGNTWNEQQVGAVLTIGGIAGILAQAPAGWLVDKMSCKRLLIIIAVLLLAASAIAIATLPSYWPVLTAQILIGTVSSIFAPVICAISLGVVGHKLFDARQGRNQAFNSAGNVVAAVCMGALGYYISNRSIFFFVAFAAIPTLLALLLIRPEDIDNDLARSVDSDKKNEPLLKLLRNHPLIIFLLCSVLFHFANAAMLPLLGQKLAKGQGRSSMMFMSACIITTQIVITFLANWSGRKAGIWGRKKLLLIAFAVLPLRGLLYTLTNNPTLLVSIQVLDGIAAAIFGVVSVLVVADLTRGSGRFNLALGGIAAAVGIGASLSQYIAGSIVFHFGFTAGMLFLAAVAMFALVIFFCFMPETGKKATNNATD